MEMQEETETQPMQQTVRGDAFQISQIMTQVE